MKDFLKFMWTYFIHFSVFMMVCTLVALPTYLAFRLSGAVWSRLDKAMDRWYHSTDLRYIQ